MARPAKLGVVRAQLTAPPSTRLADLDVARYEVFSVASDLFWRQKPDLVRGFFSHLDSIGSAGFLAAASERVCKAAAAELRVACVVCQHYRYDGALSKERWRIILHFLRRGRRILYAGLDVRFLRPVRSLFHAGRTPHALDAGFEGTFDPATNHVDHFTPDVAAAWPTARAIAFFEGLCAQLRARSFEGLPAYMQVPTLLRWNLMGPAEQDLLSDVLLSALYNRSVAIRKYEVAKGAAALNAPPLPSMENASLPQCTRAGQRASGHLPAWRAACGGAAVLVEDDVRSFASIPRPLGSPTLFAAAADQRRAFATRLRSCRRCRRRTRGAAPCS